MGDCLMDIGKQSKKCRHETGKQAMGLVRRQSSLSTHWGKSTPDMCLLRQITLCLARLTWEMTTRYQTYDRAKISGQPQACAYSFNTKNNQGVITKKGTQFHCGK